MTKGRGRQGFTLVEMVVVLAVLTILLAGGAGLIVTALRTGTMAGAADDRVRQRAELASLFRADVARADAAPDKLDDLAAAPGVLILRNGAGSAVVYRWEADALTRTERHGDRETVRPLPPVPRHAAPEFLRPAAGVVTLRMTETPPRGPVTVTDISAALGGNAR